MNIPLQPHFLYKENWTLEIDTILVDTIIRLKEETGWTLQEFPNYFLMTATREIKAKLAVHFNEAELRARLKVLCLRYRTFKEVLRHKGTYWDMDAKCVDAADCVWTKILKNNAFAGAYYHQDEPQYSKIACLLGMDDVKVESAKEVIVISVSTEKLSPEDSSCYEVGDDTKEVNSPAIFPQPTVRHKLFIEDDEPTDRESTIETGIYFIDVGPDGQLRTRLEKSRALTKNPFLKKDKGGPSLRSSHVSSCASNSL
ncbi:hypothetical protein AAHA92_03066 [Salvia divinorum]|uniref:Myb/SANT-like domain-containing protein n=1 Tax=Salvia divinorum TaxID=28513 RepID=A0ABD1IIE4_SALDI